MMHRFSEAYLSRRRGGAKKSGEPSLYSASLRDFGVTCFF